MNNTIKTHCPFKTVLDHTVYIVWSLWPLNICFTSNLFDYITQKLIISDDLQQPAQQLSQSIMLINQNILRAII